MKRKILLLLGLVSFVFSVQAQKKLTAYAITGPQKGNSNWSEVRLVDVNSGDEVQSVYQNTQQVELFNARTGKPIASKTEEPKNEDFTVQILKRDPQGKVISQRVIVNRSPKVDFNKPFATNSAACAYDRKHERLYYTPMGINQLRYIDLKNPGKIYYFEDVPFGALENAHDVPNQITRMVFGSDGNGYALTNNSNHLYQFTTSKKAMVTDLGELSDDAANGTNSVHSSGGYGGDMIADANGNLYLITANHKVFRFAPSTKVATFVGAIKGLPAGFSTNGAMVDEGSSVIVCSSNSTQGYFRFDLNTLMATKASSQGPVFNASDLANGNLAFEKKKHAEEKQPEEVKPEAEAEARKITPTQNQAAQLGKITVYPNPVTNGVVKLAFEDLAKGAYQVQFMDVSGKLINTQQLNISNRTQVEELRLPSLIASGNYVLKVINESNEVVSVNKLVVQQ